MSVKRVMFDPENSGAMHARVQTAIAPATSLVLASGMRIQHPDKRGNDSCKASRIVALSRTVSYKEALSFGV